MLSASTGTRVTRFSMPSKSIVRAVLFSAFEESLLILAIFPESGFAAVSGPVETSSLSIGKGFFTSFRSVTAKIPVVRATA